MKLSSGSWNINREIVDRGNVGGRRTNMRVEIRNWATGSQHSEFLIFLVSSILLCKMYRVGLHLHRRIT